LTLQSQSKVRIEVYTLSGKLVLSKGLGAVDANITEKLDISGLQQGIYIVKVTTSEKTVSAKLVKL
jgi:hypothetical protein